MLKFKDIKEFAASVYDGSQKGFGPLPIEKLVFPPGEYPYPYEDVVKSDSILEMFYPSGLGVLEGWLLDVYGKILPKYVLETMTFSHLLDSVNGIKDDRVKINLGTAEKPLELIFDSSLVDIRFPCASENTPQVKSEQKPSESEWLESGHANPLWCKEYLHKKGRDIMMKKNHDYTGVSGDPYENFRGSREFDIDPVLGILLRSQDKFKRIATFVLKGELKVQDESIEDALVDVQNYMDLIYGLIKGKRDES